MPWQPARYPLAYPHGDTITDVIALEDASGEPYPASDITAAKMRVYRKASRPESADALTLTLGDGLRKDEGYLYIEPDEALTDELPPTTEERRYFYHITLEISGIGERTILAGQFSLTTAENVATLQGQGATIRFGQTAITLRFTGAALIPSLGAGTLPTGGSAGTVLVKAGPDDYDAEWTDMLDGVTVEGGTL